ncbi:YdjY domain-containing protein [uncultured Finegoldia sp.]|uniref:YdjY domain-containing protein n=1 Tax=uncultured Finegoldia sp. TaxID=328009 RepID=UPI0026204F29|nr:YdjY domain-containing protein [uncultured Finegoldia sp.]
MNLRKKLLAGLLCLAIVGLSGCGQKADEKKEANNTQTQSSTEKKEEKKPDEVNGVSKENPIKVDEEKKTVTVLCSVNGKYFTENTRHASVFTDGSNGAKSILTAYGTPENFFNALVKIGAKPGNNMNPDNATKTHVEGSKIKATVTWEGAGKDYDINDVIKDSSGKKIDFRFGGNLERANKKKTGCLSCLDSCPVGIVSNAAYTYGAVEKRNETKFTGNADVLPEDGTFVAVTYSLAE